MSTSGIMTRRAEWTLFALVAAALFMVVLDVSITNVALPSIKEALHYPIVLGITSFFIPNFVSKYGYKRFLIAGLILVGLALLWLARLPVDGSYFTNLLPALVLLPLGIGLTFTPLIAAATSGVPRNEAGLASGLITTSQQMGGALGLAILSGVATSVAASAINPHARDALVHGYNYAFLTAVAFILFAIILAITVIRQQPLRNREAQTIK